jgi:hypothetical protein
MVFIVDEGSNFKAPLDKVWKLNQSEGQHSHPSLRNMSGEMQGEHVILSYETKMPDGSWVKQKAKTTAYPPLGIVFETIEGPMTGSKSFQFYTPRGKETGVTVVGEYVSKGASDSDIKKGVMAFLSAVFDEDQKNLSKV